MIVRLWLGIATFVAGAVLFAWSRRRPGAPTTPQRLALALAALGLATLASTQPGLWWSVGAIGFSTWAIVLLIRVLQASLRR